MSKKNLRLRRKSGVGVKALYSMNFFGSKLSYLEKIQEAVLKQEELLPYSGKAV